MVASEAYRAGRLGEAIEAQVREVKAHPVDTGARMFLFELLAFAGEYDRARRQIEAIRCEQPAQQAALAAYHGLLDSESARRRLFQEGMPPKFLAEPPAHVRLRLEAVKDLREGRGEEASRRLEEADRLAGTILGTVNGSACEGFRDADGLFGTVLEVFAKDEYYWVPLEQVDSLAMVAPAAPRDLIWVPARIEIQGSNGEVFLPALYPRTAEQTDDALKLGRATDWLETDGGPVLGLGSRQFLMGDGDLNILEWREFRAGG